MRIGKGIGPRSPAGFTLIEMLVVIGLILILATITVAFLPTVNERQNTLRAADRLQGWLLVAKQWAKRDGVPTGIRLQAGTLLPGPGSLANRSFVTDLQYIQQPGNTLTMGSKQPEDRYQVLDPTTGLPIAIMTDPSQTAPPYTLVDVVPAATADFSGGLSSQPSVSQNQWAVQAGDYLEVNSQFCLIQGLPSATQLQLYLLPNPSPPGIGGLTAAIPSPGTTSYKIHRAPRVLAGEPTLQLSQGVAIDLGFSTGLSLAANPTLPPAPILPFDIVFAPSGTVIGPASINETIALWVRDVTQNGLQGDMTVITIYCKTGFIAAQQPNMLNTTVGTSALSPGNTSFTLSNVAGITPFVTYLVLDSTGTNPETQLVTAVDASTNTVTVPPVLYSHNPTFTVIVDPFSYTRDGRSGGL